MLKFKNKLAKRILAFVLSGAMVVSGITTSGITAYAAENSDNIQDEYYEEKDDAVTDTADEDSEKLLSEKDKTTSNEDYDNAETTYVEEDKRTSEKDVEEDFEKKASEIETENIDMDEPETKENEEDIFEDEKFGKDDAKENDQIDEDVNADYNADLKTDIWDFGGVQVEDESVNNMLTAAPTLPQGIHTYGDLRIYSSGHINNISLADKTTKGIQFYGLNGARKQNHYGWIEITATAGDVITVVANASSGDIMLAQRDNSGFSNIKEEGGTIYIDLDALSTENTQILTTDSSKTIDTLKFYAPKDGDYLILSGNTTANTLVISRITREHVDKVPVTGNITAPSDADLSNAKLTFTDNATKETEEVSISSNSYSVNLYEKHSYTISVSEDFEVSDDTKELDLSKGESNSHDITLKAAAATAELKGTITVPEDSDLLDSLKIMFTEADDTSKSVEVTIKDDKTYTAKLKTGTDYIIKSEAERINDYELNTSALSSNIYSDGKINISETVEQNIEYKSLLVNTVQLTVSGKDIYGEDITTTVLANANAQLVFTRSGDDYQYVFKVGDPIKLREGTYNIRTANSAYISTPSTKNLVIGDEGKELAIEYKCAIEWDFTASDFQQFKYEKESSTPFDYNGLKIKYAKTQSNMIYIYSKGYSTISVPVVGDCRITFSTDTSTEYPINIGESSFEVKDADTDDGTRTYKYDYTGNGANIEISVENGSWQGTSFKNINVTYAKQIKIADDIKNGTVTAKKQNTAIPGDTVKVSDIAEAEPSDDYAFDEWKVTYKAEDGTDTSVDITGDSNSGYKFIMPNGDVTISAIFKQLGAEHNIGIAEASDIEHGTAAKATGEGSITKAKAGESVDLDTVATATPESANYTLGSWEISYIQEGISKTEKIEKNESGKYIFTMPNSDVTVKPVFVLQYKINVITTDVEHGSVSLPTEKIEYAKEGDKVFLKDIATATPDNGYEFKEWKVTYQNNGADTEVSVTKEEEEDIFIMPKGDVIVLAVFEEKGKVYVAEGTYDFTPATATLDIDGFTFAGFTGYEEATKGHGFKFDNDATIKLNLKEKANITVVSCCFGSGKNVTMTASSGKVNGVEEVEAKGDNGDLIRKKFTVLKAVAGELTLTFGGGSWIHSVAVEYPGEAEAGTRNIDVWDFGGKQETNTSVFTYNNNITVEGLKEIVNNSGNIKGHFKGDPAEFGDLTMYSTNNDYLYTNISELSDYNKGNYGDAQHQYDDSYTAAGAWFCNGNGGASRRYVTVKMQEGDKLVAYMGSSNGDIEYLFEGQGGAQGQTESVTIASGAFQKCEFVAEKTGTYKIYSKNASQGKPMYHRFVRIPAIAVSGKIDYNGYQDKVANAIVKFKNTTTKLETEAEVDAEGNFTAILTAGYEYRAILSGAVGYGFESASKYFTTKDEEYKTGKKNVALKIVTQTTYSYAGEIVGFASDYDTSNLAVTMIADKESEADDVELDITAGDKITFTAILQPEVKYTFELEGVNDYEIKTPSYVNNEDSSDFTNSKIEVQLKPVYPVTGAFIGLDDSAQVSALTFTNVEDGYIYHADVNADGKGYSANLRDGEYLAVAMVTNFKTQTHIVVDGSAASKDLMFVSTVAKDKIPYAADVYVGYPNQANNYETVSKAMEACDLMNPAPTSDSRITVHIAPGEYREQIIINTPYISLVNDTNKEVLLTWYYGIGYKYYSADSRGYYNPENAYDKYEKNIAARWGTAVYVKNTAKAFRAEGITFENSFNRYITDEELEDGVEISGMESITVERKRNTDVTTRAATERATAIVIEGDEAEFKNCSFFSSQDTVYTQGEHIYFKNCVLEGQTDYVFGSGNCVLDACELSWKGYNTNLGGYITANSPQNSDEKGYLFRNCTVTANNYNKLKVTGGAFGRPWGVDAKVIFMNTKLQKADLITDAGWEDMSGKPEDANFYEYNTTTVAGTSVDTSKRRGKVMNDEDAAKINVTDYFGSWTPFYYVAEADTVGFTDGVRVSDNGDINAPYPGHTLTVRYSLGEANDANDASIIRWYIVGQDGDGTETLVKESTAAVDKTYQIEKAAIGKYIKVTVTPQTVSGKVGEPASYTVEEIVRDGWDDPSGGSDITLGDGVNVFIAGDSTVKDYSATGMWNGGQAIKEGAWGEFIQYFFDESKVTIQNYAQGGRSSRTFINEGKLKSIEDNMGEGDYLLIQFGHNDCADDPAFKERYVPVGTPDADGIYPTTQGEKDSNGQYPDDGNGTFKWFLKQYIDAARGKDAIPVLVTPVARMYYTADGKIRPHHDDSKSSNNAYVTAMKQLAAEENVLLIDGYELTKDLFESAWTADGNNNNTYGRQIMQENNGATDSTHNNKLGGMIEAAAIAAVLQNMDLSISPVVKAPTNVLGETPQGVEVFHVNRQGKFTAYDMLNDYTTKAAYWEKIGQAMFDAIKERADEIGGGSSDNRDTVSAPTANIPSGTSVRPNTEIVLSSATDGAKIYYTLDGTTTPNAENGILHTTPITFTVDTTIKAIAVKDGYNDSEVVTFTYKVSDDAAHVYPPTANIPTGTAVESGTKIILSCMPEDAKIYYTLDGTTIPSENNGILYENPIEIIADTTIIAIAVKNGETSEVSKFVYTLKASGGNGNVTVDDNAGIEIVGLADKYPYTGAAITPDFSVVDNGIKESGTFRELSLGIDYTVKYSNNKKEGSIATVTVIGKGNYVGKEVTDTFEITAAKTATVEDTDLLDLKGAKIGKIAPQDYTGKKIYPDFVLTVKNGSPVTYEYVNDRYVQKVDETSPQAEAARVADVNVAISNNLNKGTATILVTGKKDAKGKVTSVKATFKINAIDLSKAGANLTVNFVGEEAGKEFKAPYAVKGAMPAVTVSYKFTGENGAADRTVILRNGRDYTVKYSANKKADATGKVVITGKGNYTKKAPEKTFIVDHLDMKDTRLVAADAYEGAKAVKLKAVVVDVNGDALKATQYTVKIYTDKEGKIEYAGDKLNKDETIYVQAVAKDIKNLVKDSKTTELLEVKVGSNIAKAKVKLEVKSKAYTGVGVTLNDADLTVTMKGVTDKLKLKPQDESKEDPTATYDFEIVSYSNNINKGTATAVIKGIGAYSGTKTIKFKIAAKEMRKNTTTPTPEK